MLDLHLFGIFLFFLVVSNKIKSAKRQIQFGKLPHNTEITRSVFNSQFFFFAFASIISQLQRDTHIYDFKKNFVLLSTHFVRTKTYTDAQKQKIEIDIKQN